MITIKIGFQNEPTSNLLKKNTSLSFRMKINNSLYHCYCYGKFLISRQNIPTKCSLCHNFLWNCNQHENIPENIPNFRNQNIFHIKLYHIQKQRSSFQSFYNWNSPVIQLAFKTLVNSWALISILAISAHWCLLSYCHSTQTFYLYKVQSLPNTQSSPIPRQWFLGRLLCEFISQNLARYECLTVSIL